jgi:hypothetical protein
MQPAMEIPQAKLELIILLRNERDRLKNECKLEKRTG